jgi:glycosyltransferase involved in cell wall biosynthesis
MHVPSGVRKFEYCALLRTLWVSSSLALPRFRNGSSQVRVLHVINSVHPGGGGPVECIAQISGELGRTGDHVEVAAIADEPASSWFDRIPAKVHGLGPALGRYSLSFVAARWLRFNVGRFDAVVVHGIWQYQALATYWALSDRKIPYFVYAHGMLDRSLRGSNPVRYAKKFVYWLLSARAILKNASGVLFTSCEEEARSYGFFPADGWKRIVVGNGIAPPPPVLTAQLARFHNRFPNLRSKRVILFLGRIHPVKGLDTLIRSFSEIASRVANLHLLVAGGGSASYEASLKNLSNSLVGLDNVTWAGILTGEEKWAAYEVAELFVLPSHSDSFGIAVVEALATGTPVLISDKVGIWRTITKHAAGSVCGDDRESLTTNLEKCCAVDTHRAQIGANALACFEENYRVSHAAANLRNAIRATLSETRSESRYVPPLLQPSDASTERHF